MLENNGYPMHTDQCPRQLLLVGKKRAGRIRAELVRLSQVAAAKRLSPTRAELTPPLQTPDERAQGNTKNARMHRLLNGGMQ